MTLKRKFPFITSIIVFHAHLKWQFKTHNFRTVIILWHPQLLELNVLWNPTTNKPFFFTYLQLIISSYRAKLNKIRKPHQQFWPSIAILLPQSYSRAIFRVPQSISKRYFVLDHQPPYLIYKKPKQMHLCSTDKDIRAIAQISIDPRFEIKDFLNELQNEWTILRKHECFHQICHDIIILLSQFHRRISKTSINIFMRVPNYKKP